MTLPNTFANVVTATGLQLDQNFSAVGLIGTIPCAVSGINALTLNPLNNTPVIPAYQNYLQFSGVALATNTGFVTAQVATLPSLNVYKDTVIGPVGMTGNELQVQCLFVLTYDAALNTGLGGFHFNSVNASVGSALNPGSFAIGGGQTQLRLLSAVASLTFPSLAPAASSDQTISVPGAQFIDSVSLGLPAATLTGIVYNAFVSSASVVTVRATNVTAGALTPTGGNYRVSVFGFA